MRISQPSCPARDPLTHLECPRRDHTSRLPGHCLGCPEMLGYTARFHPPVARGSPCTPVGRPSPCLLVALGWLSEGASGIHPPASSVQSTAPDAPAAHLPQIISLHALPLETGARSHKTRKAGPSPPLPAHEVRSLGGLTWATHLEIPSSQLAGQAPPRKVTGITYQQTGPDPPFVIVLTCTWRPA